ncbi:MAG: hypothetical protein NTY09_09075 [bacterium]|nr:hypothetical protein [bacterium]
MDKDKLINLLPEEYLPEPEFKIFPIFAAVLIILTILFVYMSYQRDQRMVTKAERDYKEIEARVGQKLTDAMPFLEIQRNARFISSYFGVIPNMVLQAPDYWEIYNELERLLPERTWIANMAFRAGAITWPNLTINFLSKGYSFEGPLTTYDNFLGKPDVPTRFRGLQMDGYQRVNVGPDPGSSFTLLMRVAFPTSMRIEDKGKQEEGTETQGQENQDNPVNPEGTSHGGETP